VEVLLRTPKKKSGFLIGKPDLAWAE